MANHKSSKKRILITEKKRSINISQKTSVKTATKKAEKAIEAGDKVIATAAVRAAESKIMKSSGKIMPKKRAAHKVSRLTKMLNKIGVK